MLWGHGSDAGALAVDTEAGLCSVSDGAVERAKTHQPSLTRTSIPPAYIIFSTSARTCLRDFAYPIAAQFSVKVASSSSSSRKYLSCPQVVPHKTFPESPIKESSVSNICTHSVHAPQPHSTLCPSLLRSTSYNSMDSWYYSQIIEWMRVC